VCVCVCTELAVAILTMTSDDVLIDSVTSTQWQVGRRLTVATQRVQYSTQVRHPVIGQPRLGHLPQLSHVTQHFLVYLHRLIRQHQLKHTMHHSTWTCSHLSETSTQHSANLRHGTYNPSRNVSRSAPKSNQFLLVTHYSTHNSKKVHYFFILISQLFLV